MDETLSSVMTQAIRNPPTAGREAVVLVSMLGMSPVDASILLDISRSAVDVRLNRALNTL